MLLGNEEKHGDGGGADNGKNDNEDNDNGGDSHQKNDYDNNEDGGGDGDNDDNDGGGGDCVGIKTIIMTMILKIMAAIISV